MALIVEDGSIVANADSYVSRADYIAYAADLGVTIADAEAADVELRTAAQYIDQHEDNLKGLRYSRDQEMAFPRSDLWIDGWSWGADEIPRQLILCQMAFALDVHNGEDLWNRELNPNRAKTMERVEGAVTVQYESGGVSGQKLHKKSTGDALLASLLRNNGLSVVMVERA